MAKIPKNLSDKDMFKGWQEEPDVEAAMPGTAGPPKSAAARPPVPRAPGKREGAYQTYLSPDAIDALERLLLAIKVDLYQQGIQDYRIHVRREGNTILLEHQATGQRAKK